MRVGPLDAVADMGGYVDKITGVHLGDPLLPGEGEPGSSLQDQHPLISLLVVPLAGGGRVSVGGDAFEFEVIGLEQRERRLGAFRGISPRGKRGGQDIANRYPSWPVSFPHWCS